MEKYYRTICIPLDVQRELYDYCEANGLKKSWLAGESIRLHLQRLKKKPAARRGADSKQDTQGK